LLNIEQNVFFLLGEVLVLVSLLKSKIAYARVTQRELFYVGSITIDEDMMDAVGIVANERVQIVNLNNGERLETYVIPGERGSHIIALNGPAARKAAMGDQLFILAYAWVDPEKDNCLPRLLDLREASC
jgi:aspartate 1-decarboxylase